MKLDVFHACQQVVRTISPPDALYRDILKNFSQIFQEDDDQGELRIKSTPNNHKIKCTLNTFLERWTNVPSSPLTRSALEEIRNLRCHIIAKGCLSDIPVGYSTKKNEQLHRLFNKSFISGNHTNLYRTSHCFIDHSSSLSPQKGIIILSFTQN